MIRTVTLNTGFDELLTVSDVPFGGVGEVRERRVIGSGKGVNAARVVRALGGEAIAYGLAGETGLADLGSALRGEGIPTVLLPAPGDVRRNLTLFPADGRPAAHLKAEGLDLTGSDAAEQLAGRLAEDIHPGDVVTINGSSPRGAPAGTWAAIVKVALRSGARLIVDTEHYPLALQDAEAQVLVCAPNREEVGGHVAAALLTMAHLNIRLPIVTMGGEGVRFADGEAIWEARCPARRVRLAVGAGDAFVGGLAVAAASGEVENCELVRHGIAAATAHVEGCTGDGLRRRAAELRPAVVFQRA